tara:strand:- start:1131 stop:1493 length:363 start_codon:yes stop_codon:yes gene_type:complete
MKFTKQQQIQNLFDLNNLDVDVRDLSFEQRDEETPFDHIELFDEIQSVNGFIVEVIYYYKAIKYLQEFDASLNESLELAEELGYELNNINSELLASLLASKYNEDKFWELEEEINLILKK